MFGVALGAMSPSGNTKVLSLLAIAQRLEARWPDSEGQRFDSQKSWSAKPLNGKQTWPTSCRPTTTTYVANHSGSLLLCTPFLVMTTEIVISFSRSRNLCKNFDLSLSSWKVYSTLKFPHLPDGLILEVILQVSPKVCELSLTFHSREFDICGCN